MVLFVDGALLPEAFASNVRLEIDPSGTIASVTVDARPSPEDEIVRGTLLPGMTNAHSHAFQWAMAGRAERRSGGADTFWSWRETMYALAARLTPDELYAIAYVVYARMLRAGFTSVAEFQYIHRDPNGRWYAQKSAMADALVSAARAAGIAVALLPALYAHGDVRGAPLHERQKRFATGVDDVLEIAAALRSTHADDADVTVGICAHSLRAVTPSELKALVSGSPADDPVHLHAAEQLSEVEAVEAALGARPIAWLLENASVDARWNLVHATHMTQHETTALASSGANVVLAPTTEANLGDGIFPLRPYLDAGGSFAIGSDSNVSIDVVEELRLLEYGQRLATQRRNVAATAPGESTGEALYRRAALGGARATGRRCGAIAVGMRADFVLVDTSSRNDDVLDRYIFASLPRAPERVMVSGTWMDLARDRVEDPQ